MPAVCFTTGYDATNEDLRIHHMLLEEAMKRGPVKHVACIASGGEVPLQVLAPKVKSVVAIDYSRRSLAWAIAKTILLQSHEPEQAIALLSAQSLDAPEWDEVLMKTAKRRLFPLTQLNRKAYQMSQDTRRTWRDLPADDVRTIAKASRRIEYIHGDLNLHLKERAPYDLLYVSNALTFHTSEGKYLDYQALAGLLRPGGFMISTTDPENLTSSSYRTKVVSPFKNIHGYASYVGGGSSYKQAPLERIHGSWGYFLSQVADAPAAQA